MSASGRRQRARGRRSQPSCRAAREFTGFHPRKRARRSVLCVTACPAGPDVSRDAPGRMPAPRPSRPTGPGARRLTHADSPLGRPRAGADGFAPPRNSAVGATGRVPRTDCRRGRARASLRASEGAGRHACIEADSAKRRRAAAVRPVLCREQSARAQSPASNGMAELGHFSERRRSAGQARLMLRSSKRPRSSGSLLAASVFQNRFKSFLRLINLRWRRKKCRQMCTQGVRGKLGSRDAPSSGPSVLLKRGFTHLATG